MKGLLTRGILLCTLLLTVFVLGGCLDQSNSTATTTTTTTTPGGVTTPGGTTTGGTTAGTDATLKASSKIKGVTIGSLGTPGTIDSATGGAITIHLPIARSTTSTALYFTTLIEPTVSTATVQKVVKYAAGASTANFGTDTAYNGQSVSANDIFVIKVVAEDTTTTNYYKIAVTIDNPKPVSYTIIGSSIASQNGTYIEDGTSNGRTNWTIGGNVSNHFWYNGSDRWILDNSSFAMDYDMAFGNTDTYPPGGCGGATWMLGFDHHSDTMYVIPNY